MIKFKEDRKLDNRREPCDIVMIRFIYYLGDKKIKEEKLKTISRSGYCLDYGDGNLSISFSDISKLQIWGGNRISYVITDYEENKDKAMKKMMAAITKKKQEILKYVANFPVAGY